MEFKGAQGKWRSVSLFLEYDYDPDDIAVFTYKSEDHTLHDKTYLSARRLFVETDDPTGYTFATEHIGGWEHWKAWLDSPILRKHIDEWVEETEVKIKSQGIRRLIKDIASESKSSVTSAKYIADKGYKPKRKAGAPSKAERERQTKVDQRIHDEVDDDLQRIKLV